MRIIISPAKKMNIDCDDLPFETMPEYLKYTQILLDKLRSMTYQELKALWLCNDRITRYHYDLLSDTDATLNKRLTPAILAYEGIQYQYMAPHIFESRHFEYVNEHLRILSGFYGILRPFDGVIPYRLEMQARLKIPPHKNLYAFWGNKLANSLMRETDTIINLASKEYSKTIIPNLEQNTKVITCHFVEQTGTKLVAKGTRCKMARGAMVRYMAEHNIKTIDQIKAFNDLDYRFSITHSDENNYYFIAYSLNN